MKCLTICQPWAWAIVHGPKRIENRTWPTNHRGKLLIHAGKSRDYVDRGVYDWWRSAVPEIALPSEGGLVFGAILGVATLAYCAKTDPADSCSYADRTNQRRFCDEGCWWWVLRDVQRLEKPITYRGAQGLFDVRDELAAEIVARAVPA